MAAPNGTVNALAASDSVLSFFWDLASLDQEVRDKAALGLCQELLASQQQFEQESELESDAGEHEVGHAQGNKGRAVAQALRRCSPLMSYGMKRLVRGLGSSRQGARQGFALALTLVLGKAGERGCISAQDTATVITSVLEAAGSAKGSEQRDMLLGQVFGLGSLVRSGMSIDAECACAVAASLVSVAEKKSFLREVSAAVLLELAERVDDAVLAAIVEGVEGLKGWLTAPPASATPEALLLAVRLWSRLPTSVLSSCALLPAGCSRAPPATLFTTPTLAAGKAAGPAATAFFSPAHLEALVPVLRASTHSHPRLHPLWPTLLALLIPGFHPDKEQRQSESGQNAAPRTAELGVLWGSVVETELFASSHERKYLGFMLFAVLLPHLKSEHVPLVFTPNFLRCLSNNLTKQDNYLHSTAKKCLDRITAFAERAEPSVRVAVSLALQRHGGAGFEKLTKAKKAGGMLEGVGGEALQGQISQLKQTFHEAAAAIGPSGKEKEEEGEEEEGEEEGSAGSGAAPPRQQQWAVEQLCTLCKQPAAGLAERRSVLHFLALHAFFRLDPKAAGKSKDKELRAAAQCSPQLSPAARRLCASRLLTLTDSLSKPPGKQQPQQQVAADGSGAAAPPRHDYLSDVVGYVGGMAQLPMAMLVAVEASEGAEGALDALRPLTETLTKRLQADGAAGSAGGEEGARLRALRHLAGLLALQLLGDPAAVDASAAHDLAQIYAAAFEGAEPQGADGEEGGAPHWMDTLVDVLLALLAPTSTSLPSAPLREAVEHVFRVFCDQLTPTGMHDLLRIISRPVEQSEANEEEEGVFDSEEEEEGGSDADASSDEDAGSSDVDAEEEEGGSSSEEEEEEEGGAPAKGAAKSGDDGGGSGSDSDESEGMDDEAMFRMDAKLATYFAAARDSKRGVRAQREELLNFKMRVAALLEALVKKAPASPLLPSAVLPLLSALAACSKPGSGSGGQEALAQRLAGLIQSKLCKSRAEASGAAAGAWVEEEAGAALRRCLYLASRSPDKRVLQAASAAYQYLLRVAAGAAGGLEKSKQAVESVTAALDDLFTKKRSRLARPFFEGMMRPPLSVGPLLLPLLLEHSLSARSDYLRGEAAALLAAALKARSRDVDNAAARLSARVGAVVLDALRRPVPGKAQRQVEALKAACALVESVRRGAGSSSAQALGAKLAAEVEETLGAAQQAEQAPKVAAQLQRLGELLRSGGGGAAGGKLKAAGGGEGNQKKAKLQPKQTQPKEQQQQHQGDGAGSPGKRKQAGGKGAAGKRPRT